MGSPKPAPRDESDDVAAALADARSRPLGEKLRERADIARRTLEAAEADPAKALLLPELRRRAAATLAAADHHDRRTAEAGEHADFLIDNWIATADIALVKSDTSQAERKQWLQIKTICAAGLSQISDSRKRLRKTEAAQGIYQRVVIPYIEARTSAAQLDQPQPIPRALLRATEPKSHDPKTCSPTRGPPTRGEPSDDPSDDDPSAANYRPSGMAGVDFDLVCALGGHADGPALVDFFRRRGYLDTIRASGKRWTRQLCDDRWGRFGCRADPRTVDACMKECLGVGAETIGGECGVWRLGRARATRQHSADARRHDSYDLMGMAA
jgi:hypothetical protein